MNNVIYLPEWFRNLHRLSVSGLAYHWSLTENPAIQTKIENMILARVHYTSNMDQLINLADSLRRNHDRLFYRMISAFCDQIHRLFMNGQQIRYHSAQELQILVPLLNDLGALSYTDRRF